MSRREGQRLTALLCEVGRTLTLFAIFAPALAAPLTSASAQMAKPQPIVGEVPSELRTPLAEFLGGLGVKDSETAIREAKFGHIGSSGAVLARIEDRSVCIQDRCLTVIGHLTGTRFIGEAMFLAGPATNSADTFTLALGKPIFRHFFYSTDGNVTLMETPEGWIVAPATNAAGR